MLLVATGLCYCWAAALGWVRPSNTSNATVQGFGRSSSGRAPPPSASCPACMWCVDTWDSTKGYPGEGPNARPAQNRSCPSCKQEIQPDPTPRRCCGCGKGPRKAWMCPQCVPPKADVAYWCSECATMPGPPAPAEPAAQQGQAREMASASTGPPMFEVVPSQPADGPDQHQPPLAPPAQPPPPPTPVQEGEAQGDELALVPRAPGTLALRILPCTLRQHDDHRADSRRTPCDGCQKRYGKGTRTRVCEVCRKR